MLLVRPALAADAHLWVAPGADEGRARAAAGLLGHAHPEVHPIDELVDAVQVLGLVDRRIEDLCGGPVALAGWRARLDGARRSLQLLDLNAALGAFALLEAELPCLADRVSPGDVFLFHLSFTELHVVAAQSRADDPAQVAFHALEAERAARRAATAGPGAVMPDDTLAEAGERVLQARKELAGQAPARVVVAGPHERVSWDGVQARSGAMELPAGAHVFQLGDADEPERIVAVQLAELAPGSATLVWARPDGAPLDREQLEVAVRTLVEAGRAPVGLAPSLVALSAGGPSYVVTGEGTQVRLWGADGDVVRLRIVDPPGQPDARPGRRDKRR